MNKFFHSEFKLKLKKERKYVIVIGDIMLDQYISGQIDRISPEAPVPVLKIKSIDSRLGGAANVAHNLVNLGVKTKLIASIANDLNGQKLLKLLKEKKINTNLIFKKSDQTTAKIRSISSNQQLLRQDYDCNTIHLSKMDEQKILAAIDKNTSIVLLSDYAKNFLTYSLTQKIIKKSHSMNIKVITDPKGNDISKYKNSFAVTPNLKEALILSGSSGAEEELDKKIFKLSKQNKIENIVVTEGSNGISLYSKKNKKKYPANSPKQVFDVSGAGDTVIASLTAGIYAGLDIDTSIQLANISASIVIERIGTQAINQNDLESFFLQHQQQNELNKIISLSEVKDLTTSLKSKGKKIGFTNGCFDILHSGHVSYLKEAKKNLDFLILGLNTDKSVKRIKGNLRPIVDEVNRAKVLSGLTSVDAIILFDESTPIKLIKLVKPDYLIKGNDYKIDEVVGHKELKKWGGEVILIDLIPEQSSSKIISKINKK